MFLAADVYPVWKKRIQAAEDSVTVFTPYLDSLIVDLLKMVNNGCRLTLITSLSPDSAPVQYAKKLESILQLIDLGVAVGDLDRIHAKVLFVDEQQIIAGSQNFTHYGRNSKEVTAQGEHKPTAVLLSSWAQTARTVTRELVERLLSETYEEAAEVDAKTSALVSKHEKVMRELEKRTSEERLEAQREKLRQAIDASKLRHRRGSVWLRRIEVTDQWGDSYPTMGPADSSWGPINSDIDMTKWSSSGIPVQLTRLRMYPLLHYPTGVLRFVRLGKNRITYARSRVLKGNKLLISKRYMQLGIKFPDEPVDGHNLSVQLWGAGHLVHTFHLAFEGASVNLLADEPEESSPSHYESVNELREALFDVKHSHRIVAELMQPFKYEELKREEKDAALFFGSEPHLLKCIQFKMSHILVAYRRDYPVENVQA